MKRRFFFIFLLVACWISSAHALGKKQPPATGDLDLAVVILDYPGAPDAKLTPSEDFLREVFTGTQGGVSVSDAFAKLSEGRVKFRNFQIFGPAHLDEPIYCDQEEKLWRLGTQAAGALVNFDQFSRVLFIMPRPVVSDHCDFWGQIAAARADMECTSVDTPQGRRCITFAWIGWHQEMKGQETSTNERLLSKYFVTKLVTHEMLHGWNLMHNNAYTDSFHEVVAGVNQAAARIEFLDEYPIMSGIGSGRPVGWLTGAHLVRLGWLDPQEWADVQESGEFEIAPLAYGQNGLKVLRIPRKKAGASDREAFHGPGCARNVACAHGRRNGPSALQRGPGSGSSAFGLPPAPAMAGSLHGAEAGDSLANSRKGPDSSELRQLVPGRFFPIPTKPAKHSV